MPVGEMGGPDALPGAGALPRANVSSGGGSRPPVPAANRGPGWLAPGSLIAAGVGYLVTLRGQGLGWETLHAGCEAALIGGLADWFAVTALFRRPLGLPIPHTDIIRRKRKEIVAQIRETLESDWLSSASIQAAVADAPLTQRGLDFLAEPANRADLERLLVAFLRHLAEGLDPAGLAEALAPELRARLAGRPASADLAAALDFAAGRGWDEAAVTAASGALGGWLGAEENVERVATLIEVRAREWAGGKGWRKLLLNAGEGLNLIDWNRLAHGAIATVREELTAMAARTDHPLREGLRRRFADWRAELRQPGPARAQAEAAAEALLAALPLASLLETLLRDGRAALLADLGRPDSRAQALLNAEFERLTARLRADAALRARLDGWLRERLIGFVTRHHAAIGDLVVRNLEKRDADSWVRDIESRVGPDLQYIRLNGALIGGLAGVALSLLRRWWAP